MSLYLGSVQGWTLSQYYTHTISVAKFIVVWSILFIAVSNGHYTLDVC